MFKTYHYFNKSDAMHLSTLNANHEAFAGYCVYKKQTVDDLVGLETVITFVAKGEKIICTQNEQHHMKAGDVLVVKSGTGIHSEILWKTRAFESINIALKQSLINDFYYQSHQTFFSASLTRPPRLRQTIKKQVFNISYNEHIKYYMHSLYPYFHNPYRIDLNHIARLKFFELLSILLETEPELFFDDFSTILPDENASFHSTIINNITNPLSLEELSVLCHMSMSTFKRKFMKLYGESPRRWIIKKRLELARLLLGTGDKTITDICFETGFENLSHFIMTFRAYHKMTPTEYRLSCNHYKMS
ncbi:MAG: AraC family transcriptional regulator [Syntrophaceae bacterium]